MRHVRTVLAACFALLGVSVHANGASLKAGDYLEDEFARVLKSTRSPYTAISTTIGLGPQFIRVSHEGDALKFFAVENWHEGYLLFRIHPDGRQDRGEQDIDYPQPRIDSRTHFWFRERGPNAPWRGYSYVGDADRAVASVALGGTYIDAHHHVVQFDRDGILFGFDPYRAFFLDNDHVVGNHFDWFYTGTKTDKSEVLAFQRHGKRLILYKIIREDTGNPNDIGRPDFEHPFMDLEEIKQP